MLHNKTIVVGVSGGIAAFKACDVVSRLKKRGAEVFVIMTDAACKFVTPLTLQILSNNFVAADMFAEPKTWEVEHIALAKKADLTVVVPATADVIGKIAHGIADDMLTTTVMACTAPVMIAPAMNTAMLRNPIVQENIRKLKSLGYPFIEPASGLLACGDTGEGKLAEVDTIIERIEEFLESQGDLKTPNAESLVQSTGIKRDLRGKRILVTAGPTREPIDPVRYITNRSTGKMGYAVAVAAAKRGAEVTLVSGPTALAVPAGLTKTVRVETAEEMFAAVTEAFEEQDAVIQCAAVADYKPKSYSDVKIKKTDGDLRIELSRTKDIAAELGKRKGKKVLVGFAAETDNVAAHALEKVRRKNFDFIVANDVTKAGAGFASDTNIITIIDADGNAEEYPLATKAAAAEIICRRLLQEFDRLSGITADTRLSTL
ncbi:MAG: bifunctional phosphopantothenoylcysteine decarboxylase/phosphopantothenate--cysteine ligase CoaBC [Treponema sp.]